MEEVDHQILMYTLQDKVLIVLVVAIIDCGNVDLCRTHIRIDG